MNDNKKRAYGMSVFQFKKSARIASPRRVSSIPKDSLLSNQDFTNNDLLFYFFY